MKRTIANPAALDGNSTESWREADVWRVLQSIIGEPYVSKTTSMDAVFVRITPALLRQRVNQIFFPRPYEGGALSTGNVQACATAGSLFALICASLQAQGRLRP